MDVLIKLYIEPTTRCNFNCTMCFRASWLDGAMADMESPIFERVVRTMPESVRTVFFGGMGEPLLHPDIVDMAATVARKGLRVEMVTNAALLRPETSRLLLKAGLDTLWVSLDSFDGERYEGIRRNGDFTLLTENLRAFNHERSRVGRLVRLGLNFAAMKSNVRQLAKLRPFAHRYGFNEINVSNIIPSDEHSEKELLYDRLMLIRTGKPEPDISRINVALMDWQREGVVDVMGEFLSSSACSVAGRPLYGGRPAYCRFVEEGNAFVRARAL